MNKCYNKEGDYMRKISIISIIVIIIDRISKILVEKYLVVNVRNNIIPNFFDLTYSKNEGAAFSILYGKNMLLLIISIVAIFIIYYLINKKQKISKFDIISYGLLLGGIIGNFLDRLVYGYVIDFLDFKILGARFAIFNIADAAIVIGAILIIIFNEGSDNDGDNSKRRKSEN